MDSERDEWFYEAMYDALEAAEEEFDEDEIADFTQDTIESVAEDLYEEVRDDYSIVEQYRAEIGGFHDRLYDHWGDAIDKLEQLIIRSLYLGTDINHEHRLEASQENDHVFEALMHLHARACQMAFEILTLLKAGFADGALARWRSLHEVAVVTLFIKKHGAETAERFLLYEHIETYYFAQSYQKHHEELGYDSIEDEVLDDLEDIKDQLVDRFGEVYDNEYGPGWALHVFANQSGGVRRLEKEAGLQHHRPFYRLASKSVHGTPKGTLDRIGLSDMPEDSDRRDLLAAGPTNAGFYDPAVLTAASINQVTSAVISHEPSIIWTIEGKVNGMLFEDIRTAFGEKAEELIEKEREVQEERDNMDIPTIARVYIGFGRLLTDEYLEENSDFNTQAEFVAAVPFDIESVDEFNQEESATFDEFIERTTGFDTADELAEDAFEHWVMNNVDTSEFDFEP